MSAGEVFGIVGPNGAGKSTVLKILMGFIRPDNGTAFLANHPADSPSCRNKVGYLPENPFLYRHLSITDHLVFAARTVQMSGRQTKQRIDKILQTVDLAAVMKNPLSSFSKGMTQRAALAYALFLKPEILIFDEPMSGLDPLGRHLVLDIIRKYQESGTTILLCSHILSDVEHISTRIGIMNKGKMMAITTPKELHDADLDSQSGTTPLESFFLHTIASENN